jgi:UDP-glucose:(heptosyl)LPS alpha-1,3-glucosyltransferase
MAPDRRLSIGLAIFRLSPTGGREHQCLALAAELAGRGHDVAIMATGEAPTLPPGVRRISLAQRRRTSHGRIAAFAADAGRSAGGFDRTVVFHLVPGFDVVFCTDPPRGPAKSWRRWLPRYRSFADLEAAAFAPDAGSLALALAEPQARAIKAYYELPPDRIVVLPPAVDRTRLDADAVARTPAEGDAPNWLWAGLAPTTKGLDRAIRALAAVSSARLTVCGLAAEDAKAGPALRLAGRLGVAGRIEWAGFLRGEALKRSIARADLLVHPARTEVTGNVIVEALINGLPVVTTDVCGFAGHVTESKAGVVLPSPFRQGDLDRAVAADAPMRAAWSRSALAWREGADLFGGIARAADLIETWGAAD